MRRRTIFLVVILLTLAILTQKVQADEPVKNKEFVWGVTSFTGQEYIDNFSPPEVPTIYLLSGVTHILRSRYTMVYYWPIDQQYKPDWSSLNEEVYGTLELLDLDGHVIQKIQAKPYLVTNPDRTLGTRIQLIMGTEATTVYNEYVSERDAYLALWAKYDEQFNEYLRAITMEPNNTELQPPAQPPQFEKALEQPHAGFPLQLQPGTYQIQLRDNSGHVVSGSLRRVISIASLRESVGYSVRPKEKWTKPELSNDINQVIYFGPETTAIYLEPFATQEYNQQAYIRLEAPQDTVASADRRVWVYDIPLSNVRLQIWSGGHLVAQILKRPYMVEQLSGSALGYRVVPFDKASNSQPDFEAFEIPAGAGAQRYRIRLVREDGSTIPGSEREMVRIDGSRLAIAYAIALLPLIIALGVYWRRQQIRARSLKELAKSDV